MMTLAHHLTPREAKYERAKAERAAFIASEAVGDPELMPRAIESLEAVNHGVGLLWPEFRRWEQIKHGHQNQETSSAVEWKFEPRVSPRVRDLVTSLTPEDRARFDASLAQLCTDAHLDNETKFSVAYPPVVVCLYQDQIFRVVYRIINTVLIDLLNVDWAPDIPGVADWDDWYAAASR